MISTNSIIYSFIISIISSIMLKVYEKTNDKEYETGEYVKIFLIVLLSSIFTFYIKTLINPLISSITGTTKGGASTPLNSTGQKPMMNGMGFKAPTSLPTMMGAGMNFNPTGMPFNTNTPTF